MSILDKFWETHICKSATLFGSFLRRLLKALIHFKISVKGLHRKTLRFKPVLHWISLCHRHFNFFNKFVAEKVFIFPLRHISEVFLPWVALFADERESAFFRTHIYYDVRQKSVWNTVAYDNVPFNHVWFTNLLIWSELYKKREPSLNLCFRKSIEWTPVPVKFTMIVEVAINWFSKT